MDDATRIRTWRQALGLPARAVASEAGIARTTLANIERGDIARAATVARVLSTLRRLATEAGVALPDNDDDPAVELEVLIFNVLADHSSDMDWIENVSTSLAGSLRKSGLLR